MSTKFLEVKMKWKAVYNLKEIGCFDTFKAAFTAIYYAIRNEANLTYQLLETAVWIKADTLIAHPIYFYDAKDLACEMGILVNGELIK